jgi:D-alanine-D-alanine ligase
MKVIVIFGGKSTEYEVSCSSASSVLKNMKKHEVTKIGITKDGRWFKTEADEASVKNGDWVNNKANIPVFVSFNDKAFVCDGKKIAADVVFPLLHGKNGEDGTIQGLLELMDIPYVGSRFLSSAICMDKAYAKIVFEHNKIKQTPWLTFEKYDYSKDPQKAADDIENILRFPVFVKPSNAGSSVGITKCNTKADLPKAFEEAFEIDRRVVVEQGFINAREVEVAVMGNEEPVASVPGRIHSANEVFDYNSKYDNDKSYNVIPADIKDETAAVIRELAKKAY